MKEKSSHNFLFKPTRQWKKEAEKEEKLSIGTRWERRKEKRRRKTTSTSKHTAWVYLSSFSVEAYAKGVEIITSPHCVCVRERERKLRGIKKEYKTGRKKLLACWRPTLKIYTQNVDEDIFFFILGRVELGDCLTHSPKKIFMCISSCTNTFTECLQHFHIHISKVSMFFERETAAMTTSKNKKWGKWSCVLEHPHHFHSLAFRSVFVPYIHTALVVRWKYRRKYFLFLENIKKRVNGFLSIPHLMQRYRDCTNFFFLVLAWGKRIFFDVPNWKAFDLSWVEFFFSWMFWMRIVERIGCEF